MRVGWTAFDGAKDECKGLLNNARIIRGGRGESDWQARGRVYALQIGPRGVSI